MRKRDRTDRKGFTLVELLVVIAIIGLLASIVGVNVMKRMKKAKQTKARADISRIADTCTIFKLDVGRYPNTIEELIAPGPDAMMWDGPYLEPPVVPLDPWNFPYIYLLEGTDFTIISYGADGVAGGDDEGMDITNHDQELGQQQ